MILNLLACFFITDAEHAARLGKDAAPADADTDTDTDTDTDSDSDTDTDTDTDSDTDTDTAPPSGHFVGRFAMTVDGTLTGTDSCEGEIVLDLDDVDVLGSFDCQFGSGLGIYQDTSGRVEGDGSGGTLTFNTSFEAEGPWEGSLSAGSPRTLTGTFRLEGVPGSLGELTLDGYFSATEE